MTIALENDAIDFITNDDSYEIITSESNFSKMNKALEDNNITEIIMNEVRFVPANYIKLDKEKEEKVLALIDALEDLGDVSDVYHNLELED